MKSMSGEEAHATGMANMLVENNLSSVKIIHHVNAKGKEYTTWELKVKSEDPFKAMEAAGQIDDILSVKYMKVE